VRILVLTVVIALLSRCSPPAEARKETAARQPCVAEWRRVVAGIDYQAMNCTAGGAFDLHLVRVDPRRAQIDAVKRKGTSAEEIGRQVAFAVNANFFDEKYDPLGLIVSNGQIVNRLHPVKWQSVYYVTRAGEARIVPVPEWDEVRDRTVTAVQAGPRLTVAGERNKVARAKPDARSGVCITADRVIFFATSPDRLFDVWQMVDLAVELGCRDSMLFDGGPSTQFFVNLPGGPIHVDGDKNVPAFIVGSARIKS
jgi:exopolysaccharide biosynthesis protein